MTPANALAMNKISECAGNKLMGEYGTRGSDVDLPSIVGIMESSLVALESALVMVRLRRMYGAHVQGLGEK